MKRFLSILATLICAAACNGAEAVKAAAKPLLPEREWKMIREVAVNYDLSDDATWLLAAIRRHENGRAGLEFGIGGPMNSGHAAHRYQDGTKSFYIQAMWAAGTVRKHYTGDVDKFAKRYNPANFKKWAKSVNSLITRLKAENKQKLPGTKPAKKPLSFP